MSNNIKWPKQAPSAYYHAPLEGGVIRKVLALRACLCALIIRPGQ